MNGKNVQTIRGYVQSLPKQSSKDGPARVLVVADDGTQYHILHKGAGVSLASNINANVEITGSVSPLGEDSGESDVQEQAYLLTVKSYRLTDGFDHPWYDDAVS